jgi:hypothetical protein
MEEDVSEDFQRCMLRFSGRSNTVPIMQKKQKNNTVRTLLINSIACAEDEERKAPQEDTKQRRKP